MNIIKSNNQQLNEIVRANKVKESIIAAQGRTIMSEVVVSTANKYSNVTNVKLMNGFGSDMITLKKYDYLNYKMDKYHQFDNISSLIGLNMELKLDAVELDTYCQEHIAKINFEQLDYLVLTIYPQMSVRLEEAKKVLKELRLVYDGFIFVNFYVQNPHQFKQEVLENIDWLGQLASMISVPIPGTVYGINNDTATKIIEVAHQHDLIVAGTICTSQEGGEKSIMTKLGLTAKECGFDVHMFGDASACDIPCEENLFEYSKVIRGKRHTYFRMNN